MKNNSYSPLSILAIAISFLPLTLLGNFKAEALPEHPPAIAKSIAQSIAQDSEEEFSKNGFIMPSKNIYCVVYGDRLRCEIASTLKPMPPQPASCNLDWGSGLVLPKRGNAYVLCAGDSAYSPNYKVLAYGKTWSKAGFVCKSRTNGLTCTNPKGNGFFLNREEWKTF